MRGRSGPSGIRTSVRIVSESTLKGAIAEAAISAAAVELGFVVLRPFPEGRRYDLVIDKQCYYLPIETVAGRSGIHLRVGPAANNQQTAINFAEKFRFGAIAQLGERVTGSHEVAGSSPASSTSNVRPLW
jgi:PD-(D/E)XK nuclease superfamily protein